MSKLPVFRLPIITSKPSAPATTPTFESCLGTFTVDSPARRDSPVEPPSPIVATATRVEITDPATSNRYGRIAHDWENQRPTYEWNSLEHPTPIVAAVPQVKIIDPATSKRKGSITYDREDQRPTHEWNSLEEFHAWRINEELDHGIELLLSSTRRSDGPLWHETRTYSCSRQGTGGKTKYVKKHMHRIRKQPSKRTGCRCRVRIKTYHHVSTVLGWYYPEHDHAIGVANLIYTRLRDSTRGYVLNLLRKNMSPKEVVSSIEVHLSFYLTCTIVCTCAPCARQT